LNEQFFGKEYESRFWELTSLVTDMEYQRRGLGSRLVEWGLIQVEEMGRKGRSEGNGSGGSVSDCESSGGEDVFEGGI